MASNAWLTLAIVLATLLGTHAGDPDITSDFIVPDGVTPDADFFTFKGLKQALRGAPMDATFKVTKASQVEFPALMGQSVSYAALQFAPGGINPPHTHPRSAELLLVVQGWLEVGLVDSNNTLFTQTLRTGDMFVFPKGLVHFQVNKDPRYPAVALSAFGSANAGTVSLPKTLFGSGIDEDILAKSFKTDAQTIDKLVSAATMG
ncbi:germin-like protein 9-3 [Elaeis guineensis]|uniref:germin-like protein 9-3 n=1 Tax=Elaeis guineensis var. tenera TaxID=51953 RepID=UPI003C6D4FD4